MKTSVESFIHSENIQNFRKRLEAPTDDLNGNAVDAVGRGRSLRRSSQEEHLCRLGLLLRHAGIDIRKAWPVASFTT